MGVCTVCGGCLDVHCQCDPCGHGYSRADVAKCVVCRPGNFLEAAGERPRYFIGVDIARPGSEHVIVTDGEGNIVETAGIVDSGETDGVE